MADNGLEAEIRREFLAGFLQEIDSHGTRVASHSASGTQPHKFNDAAGHARWQIQNIVDRNPIVDGYRSRRRTAAGREILPYVIALKSRGPLRKSGQHAPMPGIFDLGTEPTNTNVHSASTSSGFVRRRTA